MSKKRQRPRRRRRELSRFEKRKARGTGTVFLLGLAGFLYQMQDLLRSHTQAALDYYGTPAGVGEILFAAFCGVAAMLAGLGLNIGTLIRSFTKGESE